MVVYLLAFRDGVQGYRLVLIGIGMAAMLVAVTDYLLTRSTLEQAQAAQVWLTGSLNGRGWEHVRPAAVALAVLLPADRRVRAAAAHAGARRRRRARARRRRRARARWR